MDSLFSPLKLRDLIIRNRIMISPMCQYSSVDGLANDWHLVHLGSRAISGAGLVCTEAAAVQPVGRISPHDLGLWEDRHVAPLARIARFLREHGAVAAVQLAHAGRKASVARPWDGGAPLPVEAGGWIPVAPSPLPFAPGYPVPHELGQAEILEVVQAFRAAAIRAREAGFQVLEIHAAHGYLLHEFLSPLTNRRTDEYGGRFENRIRLLLQVTDAVREQLPGRLPLFVRISTTDWVEGGWDVDQSVELCRRLKQHGVDLIDCSSGGAVPDARVPVAPGYQVPAAARIRAEAGIPVAAVGLLTEARQVDELVRSGQADLIAIARESLRNPYFPLQAARELGVDTPWPPQYERARPT